MNEGEDVKPVETDDERLARLETKAAGGDWACAAAETGQVFTNGWELRYHTTQLLGRLDPNPKRQGLEETPRRVRDAWRVWASGYGRDPADELKEFSDGAEGYDGMVIVRGIPFYSHCEHHLAPFFGTADIGYIPDGKVVGLSKLSRVLDIFARRLQVQERMTRQVAVALHDNLQPKGVAVVVRARHLCMESRGIQKQGCETVTSSMLGVFMDDVAARKEFLELARPRS